MSLQTEYCFGRFRLDPPNARLMNGRQVIALKPKAFDVLAHLVRNAGRLLTQEELLRAIWPDTIVGDSSLKSCIRQIRSALGDRVRKPLFIETVHRRGYRFIAPVTTGQAPAQAPNDKGIPDSRPARILVGREAEFRQWDGWLAQARQGLRQIVFVIGGPGSGKSALVEAFLRRAAADPRLCVAAGQCFEHHGRSEAYLPLLEAIGRLSRDQRYEPQVRVLASRAPTWVAQLPGLRIPPGSDSPAPPAAAAPPERMLREMAEALEEMSAQTPLVLLLEDLHWADYSTLDLVSALARRRQPARLLLLATYRPVDAVLSAHPLRTVKQDLQASGLCQEVSLGLLTEAAVAEYLAARFPGGGMSHELARLLHQRTEGHPLFLVDLIDDWLAQKVLVPQTVEGQPSNGAAWELKADLKALSLGVPASIRALIEKQLERLSPDEARVLEGASVAGVEFAAAAAAAAVQGELVHVEECCESLARRHHFLQPKGSADWPDGTISAHYRFGHELYHRVVSERVAGARRRLLHQRLAERLEAAHPSAAEPAAELALHFEQGRDPVKAVHYLELAANRAGRNYAHREAIDYLRRALSAVERSPVPKRRADELRLQLTLGLQLQITQGFGARDAKRAYARARELCREVGETPLLFPVLWGLWLTHKVRSELPTARAMAQELFALAEKIQDPALVLQAHQALAVTTLCLGEPAATCENMRRGTALYDPKRHHGHTFMFGQDPGVACLAFGALAQWLLGYPDQALRTSREACRLSHELSQPSSQSLALHFAAMVHQCRRESRAALANAELTRSIAADQGFKFWHAGGTVMRGWALAESGELADGIAAMRQGLDSWQATGSVTYRTYFLALLAEMLGRNGCADEGLLVLDDALALVQRTSERLYEAELHRLRGELLLLPSAAKSDASKADKPTARRKAPKSSVQTEAEGCFQKAMVVARRQQAKSLELRAVMSLTRLRRQQGRQAQVTPWLAEILGWFTEGFETLDLQEATTLFEK